MSNSTSNNKMSVMQLTLLTALNMMGSGIIMLPTKLAEIGTFSILSWLVTATGSTAMAYAFAKCGMLSRRPGGMGGYSEYAFGQSGNFMANYTYAVSLIIANVAIAVTVVGYASALFDVTLSPVGTCLATIATLWICTSLNFRGPKITGYLSNFSAWGAILPVAGLSLFGWFWFSPTLYVESWNPNNVPFFSALSNSISMTLWAFLGLESACANSEAVDNPEKNVPKAVLGATIGVAVIYILSTNICAGIVDNASLVQSTAPFGLVFASMFNDTVGKIVIGMMVISCAGSLLSWQFTIARSSSRSPTPSSSRAPSRSYEGRRPGGRHGDHHLHANAPFLHDDQPVALQAVHDARRPRRRHERDALPSLDGRRPGAPFERKGPKRRRHDQALRLRGYGVQPLRALRFGL